MVFRKLFLKEFIFIFLNELQCQYVAWYYLFFRYFKQFTRCGLPQKSGKRHFENNFFKRLILIISKLIAQDKVRRFCMRFFSLIVLRLVKPMRGAEEENKFAFFHSGFFLCLTPSLRYRCDILGSLRIGYLTKTNILNYIMTRPESLGI